jgi:RNA polymerase sigma-70 factor, ECF subfamily
MIQSDRPVVIWFMQQALPCLDGTTSFSSRTRISGRATRQLARMPSAKTPAPEPPKWELLIRAIATHQDRDAFARLFEHFAPRVKAFMQRSGVAPETAEELAQETLLMVWRKASLFDPDSVGAPAWIFTIARNLRVDAYRRNRRGGETASSEFDFDLQVDEAPRPDVVMVAKQQQTRIRAALEQLSPDQFRVIELSFFEQKPHADIAATLGIPLGTVKSRLRLAMKRLRDLLDGPS